MLRSRRDIENVDTQLVQLLVLDSTLPTVPGMIVLVDYSVGEMRPMVATALPALDWFSGRPGVPASPALPALPHTQYTHTQSHNCRHGAGRRGWDAAEQRSSGAEGDWRRRVKRVSAGMRLQLRSRKTN